LAWERDGSLNNSLGAAESEWGPAGCSHFQSQRQGVNLKADEWAAHRREGPP